MSVNVTSAVNLLQVKHYFYRRRAATLSLQGLPIQAMQYRRRAVMARRCISDVLAYVRSLESPSEGNGERLLAA